MKTIIFLLSVILLQEIVFCALCDLDNRPTTCPNLYAPSCGYDKYRQATTFNYHCHACKSTEIYGYTTGVCSGSTLYSEPPVQIEEVFIGNCSNNGKSTGYEDVIFGSSTYCMNQQCYGEMIKAHKTRIFELQGDSIHLVSQDWDFGCTTIDYQIYATSDTDMVSVLNSGSDHITQSSLSGITSGQDYLIKFSYKVQKTNTVFFTSIDTYQIDFDSTKISGFTHKSSGDQKSYSSSSVSVDLIEVKTPSPDSIGNKQNETFSADDGSDVTVGGNIRYTLTPSEPSKSIDLSSYKVSVVKGGNIFAEYSNNDVPERVTIQGASENKQQLTIPGLDLIGGEYQIKLEYL